MFNIKEKGQVSIEIIIISVIIVAMLLLVFITTSNINMETERVLTIGKNNIECNRISTVIARLYNNRATTKETINLEEEALLRRVEGNSGGINIGGASCSYIGSAEMNTGKDSDPNGTGEEGITLIIDPIVGGNWCFEKSPDTNIVITVGECT